MTDTLVYAFKKDKREKYTKKEGVVFTVNGQAQGFLPQSFFEHKSVGMSYLADSILVITDCSKFERRVQEDLFMNSRDRLRDGVAIRYEIEERLEDLIRNHPGLRALREQRRRDEIEDKLQDSKPVAEVLEHIIKKSPSLSKLFLQGLRIKNPFNLITVKTKKQFKGKKFPSYFKISKEYTIDDPKTCSIDRRFRVQFETDAENEYFNRDREPGQFTITLNGQMVKDFSLNLWNGLASLNVTLPPDSKIGDTLLFCTEATDNFRTVPFYNEFYIKIGPKAESIGGPGGKRKEPSGDDDEKTRKKQAGLSLPNIIELRKSEERWARHFKDEKDAMAVKDTGENGYDFYINMDNVFLLNETKVDTKLDHRLLEARFKYGMVLIGISLLDYYEKADKTRNNREVQTTDGQPFSVYEQIYAMSKAISPVLLPLIASLGDLDIENGE